jgi:hypothetical protein
MSFHGSDQAVAELANHDPALRQDARDYLVGRGPSVLPDVEAAMDRVGVRTAALYQELVRVRDWIRYGEDPEKLERLMRALDPRSFPHGNMRGGAHGAVVGRPAYAEVVERPHRVRRFFEAIVADPGEAYARRAAAAIGLKVAGGAETAPIVLAALETEADRLAAGAEGDLVDVDEDYRGLFLHAACEALSHHSGEAFDPGLHEALRGLIPTTVVSRNLLREALRRWRRWCELRPQLERTDADGDPARVRRLLGEVATVPEPADAPALYGLSRLGARGAAEIAAFLLTAPRVDAPVLAVADMAIRNGRGAGIPEGDRATAIIAGLLLRERDMMGARGVVRRCHGALPISTLRAAASVVGHHPLADAAAVLNPYSILDLELGHPGVPVTDAAIEAIITGFESGDPAQRAFFLDVLESVVSQHRPDGPVPLEPSLSRLMGSGSTTPGERLRIIALRTRLGAAPSLEALRALLRDAAAHGDVAALGDAIEILQTAHVPHATRPALMAELFAIAESHGDLHEGVLRCLGRLDPDAFPFNPVIGPDALLALIDIHRLRAADPVTPDPHALGQALERLRAGVVQGMHASFYGPAVGLLADRALAWGGELADRYGLLDELYQSLLLRGQLMATGQDMRLDDVEAVRGALPARLAAASEYLRSLAGTAGSYSSFDTSALLFEAAAGIAGALGHRDQRLLSPLLAAADMARRARRYGEAERRFRALDAHVAGNLPWTAQQQHHRCLLFLEQERWTDALETALALGEAFQGQTDPLDPGLEHLRLDACLHEMRCRRERGEYALAFRHGDAVLHGYHAIGHGPHFVDVLLETASTSALQGDPASAEECFALARRFLEDKPELSDTLPAVCREEAAYRLRSGAPEAAESLLRAAIAGRDAVPSSLLESTERDPLAVDLWLLGRAQIAQGKIHDARETLSRLQGLAGSVAYALHRARLEAAVQAATGAVASAIETLGRKAQASDISPFADLETELRLDLAHLLRGQGFAAEAVRVLDQAQAIAVGARNPRTIGRVRLLQARVHEQRSDPASALAVYRSLADSGPRGGDGTSDAHRLAALGVRRLCARQDPALVEDAADVLRQIREIGEAEERVDQLLRFGRLYADGGRPEHATLLLTALEELTGRGAPLHVQLDLAMLRGRLARVRGDGPGAIRHFRTAVHVMEVVHAAGIETGMGTGFLAAHEEPYAGLIDALVAGGYATEALHYAERAKTRLLVDQLHWRRASDARRDAVLDRCVDILQRLAFLELAAATGADDAHAAERAELATELDGLRRQVPERDLMAVVHPTFGTPERTMEIVKDLLGRGGEAGPVVLAEYMLTEPSILLFLVREDFAEPVVVRIERSARDVAEFVTRHLEAVALDDDGTETASTAGPARLLDQEAFRAFGAPLVAPLLAMSPSGDPVAREGAVVCFVPHGGLHYLPLHAIDIGDGPLIARNPIVYVPSATIMHHRRRGPRRPLERALVVGDPHGDLPYARQEAGAVAELFRARPWLGREATRARVLEALRAGGDGPGLLHFSCHGYFDATQPLRSGIELAPAPQPGADDAEETLTVQDIFGLDLSGSAVTLSACETGVSQQRPGDELVGLTRALLFAGAASVVISLWAVNDLSSARLMQEYYGRLRGGATRAEALRAAQLYVRGFTAAPATGRDAGAHPDASLYHWAPFVLVGDWT